MKSAAHYPVPAKEARAESVVVNSRFIACANLALTVEQARVYIQRIRAEFPEATHHVPAYLVGFGSSVTAHCNDDGEPAGTAGRPALTVLQGSGLGDVVVVVVRYFGGTKLGTGGLVRAYTDAVKAVLAVLPRALRLPTHTVRMILPYPLYERARTLAAEHQGVVLDETFAAEVTVTVRFAVERLEGFQAGLSDLSRGGIQAEVIASDADTIVPLGLDQPRN